MPLAAHDDGRMQPGRWRGLKRDGENIALRGGSTDETASHDAQKRQSGLAKSQLDIVVEAMGASDADSAVKMLNDKFEDMSSFDQPKAILKWAGEVFPKKRWAQITSFGLSGYCAPPHTLPCQGDVAARFCADD